MAIISSAHRPFYVKLAMTLISLISIGYIFFMGKEILSPLLYSFLFAILLVPFAGFLERKLRLSRGAAAGVAVLFFISGITAILYFVGSQISSLASEWPQFKQSYASTIAAFQNWVSTNFHVGMEKQLSYVNGAASKLETSSTAIIGATVASLSSLILSLVFIMIDTFFFLLYRRHLVKFLISVFREKNSVTVNEVVKQIQSIIRKYIFGLLLEMAIVTTVACTVFSIIGIKYAILLGFITGLFNIIPYIGIFTSLVLSTLITVGTAAETTHIILVIVTVVSIHLIDSNFLLPFLVGSKVKINAFITLMGVILGSMMWGISGMFLSIPIIAMAKIVFDRIESLQPWGMLLGDEKREPRMKKIVILAEQPSQT